MLGVANSFAGVGFSCIPVGFTVTGMGRNSHAHRVREQVLEDTQVSKRECREDAEDDRAISMEIRNRLYRIRKATEQAVEELSAAPLDTCPEETGEETGEEIGEEIGKEICGNELPPAIPENAAGNERADGEQAEGSGEAQKCGNEPVPFH